MTLFTDAPPAVLAQALAAVADTPLADGSAGADPAVLLALQHVTVETPAGGLAAADLSLELRPGQHLLIAGPNGCGKSTLVKALCGLHSLAGGHVGLALGGVMLVPQRPLAAPGRALWQQLCYPGADSSGGISPQASGSSSPQARPPDTELAALLQRVGLQYLLARLGGSFEAGADWGAMLSPGELQRITVARVLLR